MVVVRELDKGSGFVVDGGGETVGKGVKVRLCRGVWSVEYDSMDILALKYAKTALEDVHDGIIYPFDGVDDFVIVDAGDHVCTLFRRIDALEKLDVARIEEIKSAIKVYDWLTFSWALTRDQI